MLYKKFIKPSKDVLENIVAKIGVTPTFILFTLVDNYIRSRKFCQEFFYLDGETLLSFQAMGIVGYLNHIKLLEEQGFIAIKRIEDEYDSYSINFTMLESFDK